MQSIGALEHHELKVLNAIFEINLSSATVSPVVTESTLDHEQSP